MYTRRVYVHFPSGLEPGDLLDISTALEPYWVTVDRVGTCAEDPDASDRECDGDCLAVVFYTDPAEEDGSWDGAYHVGEHDEVYARLQATATADDVNADNDAHSAAVNARAGV